MPASSSLGPTPLAGKLNRVERRALTLAFSLLALILLITAVHVTSGFGGDRLEHIIRD